MAGTVLVIGSRGMLGRALCTFFHAKGISFRTAARSRADFVLDLTDDAALQRVFAAVRPSACINAAAVTSLDACERDEGLAYRINARLPERLAALSERCGTYFVHVSTDHFWAGEGRKKHAETDGVSLLNAYARTKYAGEALASSYKNVLILRTNIVGFRGSGVPTFLEWAISSIQENTPMTLFSDFFTSSMHTEQLASCMERLLLLRPTGLFNIASSTVSSKEEFICALSKALFGRLPTYERGSVAALATPRANSLGLATENLARVLGERMPALDEVVASIAYTCREAGI